MSLNRKNNEKFEISDLKTHKSICDTIPFRRFEFCQNSRGVLAPPLRTRNLCFHKKKKHILTKFILKLYPQISNIQKWWKKYKNAEFWENCPPPILGLKFMLRNMVVWGIVSYIFEGADYEYKVNFSISSTRESELAMWFKFEGHCWANGQNWVRYRFLYFPGLRSQMWHYTFTTTHQRNPHHTSTPSPAFLLHGALCFENFHSFPSTLVSISYRCCQHWKTHFPPIFPHRINYHRVNIKKTNTKTTSLIFLPNRAGRADTGANIILAFRETAHQLLLINIIIIKFSVIVTTRYTNAAKKFPNSL